MTSSVPYSFVSGNHNFVRTPEGYRLGTVDTLKVGRQGASRSTGFWSVTEEMTALSANLPGASGQVLSQQRPAGDRRGHGAGQGLHRG